MLNIEKHNLVEKEMIENTLNPKNCQSTITEKLKVISNYGNFGQSFHILRRNKIPCKYFVNNIESEKWHEWIAMVEQKYQWLSKNRITKVDDNLLPNTEKLILLHLEQGITLRYCIEDNVVQLFYDYQSNIKTVKQFKNQLVELKKNDTKFEIGFLQNDYGSLYVKFRDFTPYKNDLIKYLGQELESFRNAMISTINKKEESGLFLLHGQPGTGKTSFIKSVLSKVNNKAIYITPGFANQLASPELIGVLMDYPSSVIIIEDAESVLMKRQADNTNAVSNLLNLTNGFPADFLKLNIICTFNTNLNDIDPALLREGRLKGKYKFNKLSVTQAKKIANHLENELEITQPMTLAEICNTESSHRKKIVHSIGF